MSLKSRNCQYHPDRMTAGTLNIALERRLTVMKGLLWPDGA
jgi:hypothetical protein